MRITIDIPTIDIRPDDDGGRNPDGAPYGLPDCPHCHTEYGGRMARTLDGLVHEECVNAWLSRRDERDAWKVLASHVARYPSRQSASAVRAVIRALLDMQPKETGRG
ncbi:hypothetical protein [Streptomyces sp. t39]|uniref:hypothetical protein n=1 Tax=Streptomyces sp. t39 TaxID=1828156 RepID=UPI0011CD96F7|nr:hypothetical protein [Streptomyces sp. t39]TXS50154.1 hypothetical protein EAO77_27995 [Streptomyces sp. t39]